MSSAVRTAVIPAAGLGTRFLPATKAQPKEMLPVVDKPAIQYVVEEAVAAGIDDILIITGRNKRSIEDHFDRNFELEYHLEAKGKHELTRPGRRAGGARRHPLRAPGRAARSRPRGLGRSQARRRRRLRGDARRRHHGRPLDGAHRHDQGLRRARRVGGGAAWRSRRVDLAPTAAPTSAGSSTRRRGARARSASIVEKPAPADAPSNLAVMGRYLFTPAIFEQLADVEPGVGGEIQLTDAIARAARRRGRVRLRLLARGASTSARRSTTCGPPSSWRCEREDLGPEFRAFLGRRRAVARASAEKSRELALTSCAMSDRGLTHLDPLGRARMVDVTTEGTDPPAGDRPRSGAHVHRDHLAGRAGRDRQGRRAVGRPGRRHPGRQARRRPDPALPPACWSARCSVNFRIEDTFIEVESQVETVDRTGVEMEALTAASVACLTIYDMCKSVDRSMVIGDMALWEKTGGRSGGFQRPAAGTRDGFVVEP